MVFFIVGPLVGLVDWYEGEYKAAKIAAGRNRPALATTKHNKSLDASGGGVFRIKLAPAMLE